jgi:hypothetical protein
MELQTKKNLSGLVSPQKKKKKKIAKLVMATDATLHHMRKTRTIYLHFFERKNLNFLCIYNLFI